MLGGMLFIDKHILKIIYNVFCSHPIRMIDQISRFYTDIKSDIMIGNAYYPPIDLHLTFEESSLKNRASPLRRYCHPIPRHDDRIFPQYYQVHPT